jgi:GntR family transcriptional regulator, rspAB operon transcriptional repressor
MKVISLERDGHALGGRRTLDPARQAAVQIYENLRSAIIALELEPGSAIDRSQLQVSFGRSSTPIRDALARLAEEGLVDIVPQSATRVSLIDIGRARQTQFLRRALELEAVEMLSTAPDRSVVHVLRDLVARQKAAAERADLSGFEQLDQEFHARIFEAAGVSDLYAFLRLRSGHIDRIRRLHLPVSGKSQEIVRGHGLIVKAISAGDATDARRRMRDHLSSSLAYLPKLREKYPTYFR